MADRIIINIGRQYGSGGRRVARLLSEKLGIPAYDSELITEAAKLSGYSPEVFTRKDEKKSFFNLFSDRYNNDNELFRIQSEAIREIADKGSAIFIGRASDYVLREMDCLDVFLSAPLDKRAALVAERQKISADEAAELCQKEDKAREAYYNYFTFQNWGVASNYDLCIDTSILGIEGTADLIIDFARRRSYIK